MQVVRAAPADLWRSLARDGIASQHSNIAGSAEELRQAMRKKALHYAAEQRASLTLVIDASRTPVHTFHRVIDAFRKRAAGESKPSGFEAVWLVGPNDALVDRLV